MTSGRQGRPGVLREGFEYRFSRVDPVAGAHIDPTATAVYETLVAKGADGEAVPFLAESWTVSTDGTEWRFRLRPGARFHSGAPCDAVAVVRALERCRWGDARTRQMQYFDPVDTIADDGPQTVVVRTHHPTTRLMQALWGTHSLIFNEALRARDVAAYGETVADGTGPYRLAEWSPERVAAELSPTYDGTVLPFVARGRPRAMVPHIEWTGITDEAERLALLRAGELDCLHAPPAAAFDDLAADPRFITGHAPQPSSIYLGLNWSRRDLGFDDVRVRRAVSMAVDRAKLVGMVLSGHGAPTWGVVPPGSEFYDDAADRAGRCDPGGAAALLDAAGWTVGADGLRWRNGLALRLECVVQDDSVLLAVARAVAAQLRPLGIALEIEAVEPFAPFYARIGQGPASFLSKWLWPDPIDALVGFLSTGCQPRPNWQRASVPRLDLAFDRFRRAATRAEAAAAARDVQAIAAETLPTIPLLSPHDLWVHRSGVSGWRPVPENLYPFYQDVVLKRGGEPQRRLDALHHP
jgi:ABC-type transport system substrate-binding protein